MQSVEVLNKLVRRGRRTIGQQEWPCIPERPAAGGLLVEAREKSRERLGRLSRQLLTAENQRIHHNDREPVGARKRLCLATLALDSLVLATLSRVEQPLEQLDDGGAGDRARAHQPAEEASQPADGHRRVVLERALQLAMRRLHDLATDVAVGRVEQAGERCVHRGFGV